MILEPTFLIGQSIVIIGAGIAAYIRVNDRVTKLESVVKEGLPERVTKIESLLLTISEKAAVMLHSPHDPYELDVFLEKYVNKHYDLTDEEWRILLEKCERVQKDGEAQTDVKVLAMLVGTLAEFVKSLANHKLEIKGGRSPRC